MFLFINLRVEYEGMLASTVHFGHTQYSAAMVGVFNADSNTHGDSKHAFSVLMFCIIVLAALIKYIIKIDVVRQNSCLKNRKSCYL